MHCTPVQVVWTDDISAVLVRSKAFQGGAGMWGEGDKERGPLAGQFPYMGEGDEHSPGVPVRLLCCLQHTVVDILAPLLL